MSETDLNDVVQIHMKAFPGFFLTLLGNNFLYNLYRNFVLDNLSICLVAVKNSSVKGFVIGNLKPESIFRKMFFRQGYIFLLNSVRALFKNPKLVFKKLLYAIMYRGECPDGYARPALLSSIGIDPVEIKKGVGSHLIRTFCWQTFAKGADVIYLITDKYNNDYVNDFYVRNGFRLKKELVKSDGRIMNMYIKLPDEKIL
jgi:ribosomal protein S18 acetylase RimI-like enzyme